MRRRLVHASGFALALALLQTPRDVGSAPPVAPSDDAIARAVGRDVWSDRDDVPLAEWARSVEILRDGEALSASPGSPAGSRRGLVAAGVRLPLLGAIRGRGCVSRWLLVGPLSYVCADRARLSAEEPGIAESIHPTPADALPYKYYFVGPYGAEAYARPADAEEGAPLEELERGWVVASVGEVAHDGAAYVRTRRGRFIARKQLGPVAANAFHGEPIAWSDADRSRASPGREIGVGWVMPEKADVVADPKPGAKPIGARTRFQLVAIEESKNVGKERWLRVGDAEWVRARDVRAPTFSALPAGVAEGERWIDIDTATQTLVAYEGTTPTYGTVVSTGRMGSPTPIGLFRIWVKLRSATMSNVDEASSSTEAPAPYSIEDVPWVQYFSNGVAIHGAFWHRRFGEVHSHGCVNLAPLDAMRVFGWTLPRLPRGWDAVFPTRAEPSTAVQVR